MNAYILTIYNFLFSLYLNIGLKWEFLRKNYIKKRKRNLKKEKIETMNLKLISCKF